MNGSASETSPQDTGWVSFIRKTPKQATGGMPTRIGREGTLITLRLRSNLWSTSRSIALAASIALGTVLSSGASAAALDAGSLPVSADAGASSASDGTDAASAADSQFTFDGDSLEDASALVTADGDGLRVRSAPNSEAEIITTLADGTIVDLRIDEADTVYDADGVTRWWPVSVGGSEGWVSGFYLSDADAAVDSTDVANSDGTSGSESASAPDEQFVWNGAELVGATAVVAGDDVSVHVEPTTSSDVTATVADGTVVNLRIDMVDTVVDADGVTRWWPVEVDGIEGWISGFSLRNDGDTSPTRAEDDRTNGDAPVEDADAGQQPVDSDVFPSGSIAMIQTQTSSGARLRESAGTGSPKVVSLAEFSEVTILNGPVSFENSVNGWFEVEADGYTGFIDGDLLVLMSTPEPTPVPPTPTPSPVPTQAPVTDPTPLPTTTPVSESDADDTDDTQTQAPTPTPTGTATVTDNESDPPARSTLTPSGSTDFILPVEDAIRTQGFGCSPLGFYPYNPDWGCGVHDGIDFAAPSGTPILAVGDGTVVEAGFCDCGLGYYVEIDHGNNLHTIYGHMASQPFVSAGQQVAQGETIGPVGSTGLSTGPHTHFMVQVNGVSQDPARYLP